MDFNSIKANSFLRNKDLKVADLVLRSKKMKSSNYRGIRKNIISLSGAPFGDVDVHFFGSRIIGLATKSSDLDVFIDTGGNYFETYTATAEHKLIATISRF